MSQILSFEEQVYSVPNLFPVDQQLTIPMYSWFKILPLIRSSPVLFSMKICSESTLYDARAENSPCTTLDMAMLHTLWFFKHGCTDFSSHTAFRLQIHLIRDKTANFRKSNWMLPRSLFTIYSFLPALLLKNWHQYTLSRISVFWKLPWINSQFISDSFPNHLIPSPKVLLTLTLSYKFLQT